MNSLRGFGIRHIGFTKDVRREDDGYVVLLYASPELWEAISSAGELMYHERLILVLRRMYEMFRPLVHQGIVTHYGPAEPMSLAQLDLVPSVLAKFDISYNDTLYTVPPSNLAHYTPLIETLGIPARGMETGLDLWGRMLLKPLELMTPDVPSITFAMVSNSAKLIDEDYLASLITMLGHNVVKILDADELDNQLELIKLMMQAIDATSSLIN